MKCKYHIVFLLTVLLICECGRKEKNYPTEAIVIRPNSDIEGKKRHDILKVKSFADSITYVPLRLDSNTVIGKITKILYLRNRYVLFDANLAKGIFLFDRSGKLVNQIYRGEEPFDLQSIEDVTVDYAENKIYVYSGAQSCVFQLNEDGDKERTIPISNGYFSAFEKLKDGFVFYRELEEVINDDPFNNYRLCTVDSTGRFKKGWYNTVRNAIFPIPIASVFFRRINGTENVYFESPQYDTLLCINEIENELEDLSYIDFNKPNTPRKRVFRARNPDEYLSAIQHSSSINEVPLITDRFILGDYSVKGGRIFEYYYERSTKETISFSGWINDFDRIPLGAGPYYSLSNGLLITKVDNERLLGELELLSLKGRDLSDESQTMQEISRIVTEQPEAIIVCLLKLKK